jgi:hypothetical protein
LHHPHLRGDLVSAAAGKLREAERLVAAGVGNPSSSSGRRPGVDLKIHASGERPRCGQIPDAALAIFRRLQRLHYVTPTRM